MKRFLLFNGFVRVGDYDTINEAVGSALTANEGRWHVVDSETGETVRKDWQYWEALEDMSQNYNDAEREEH